MSSAITTEPDTAEKRRRRTKEEDGGGHTTASRKTKKTWQALPDDEIRAVYEQISLRLGEHAHNPKEARAGTNYLYQFVRLLEPARADPRSLMQLMAVAVNGQNLVERAHEVWAHMRASAHWSTSYLREVRTCLSRALLLVAEPLAHVVNPGMYKGACGMTEFHVRRSQRTRFSLHDCLPWRVRALAPRSVEYALLCRIGERMAGVLHSVSKSHLQSILVLFDHVLHDPPGLWPADCTERLEERWRFLAGLSPRQWLERYGATFREGRRIGFDLFKRQVRYLSQFHARVLHPDTRRYIPVPQCSGATVVVGGDSDAAGGTRRRGRQPADGWSSLSEDASSGSEEDGGQERRDLLRLLSDLRRRLCKDAPDLHEQAERLYAFTPSEVRRMVELACVPPVGRCPPPTTWNISPCRPTTQEQLILMLLLTTGLRIGGVARLQLPGGRTPRAAADVPAELTTLEKHGRLRRIHPTECCRVLLARWYQQGRHAGGDNGGATTTYVFPAGGSGSTTTGHVGARHVWTVCRGLFQRAGISGPHVHPHTFRHTVVQMLFLTGSSFESISKWIGHSSTQVTSALYGRLAQVDVERSLGAGATFLQQPLPQAAGDDRPQQAAVSSPPPGGADSEWHALADFLRQPYHFVEQQQQQVCRQAAKQRTSSSSSSASVREMRSALLERATASSPVATPMLATQLQQQTDILRELSEHLRRSSSG